MYLEEDSISTLKYSMLYLDSDMLFRIRYYIWIHILYLVRTDVPNWLRACLFFCFTKYFASRKAHLSVWRLSVLFLSYKLSLFWIVLLISWVILGSDGFVLIVCCWTFCSIPDYKVPLKSSQSKLIDLPSG